MIKRLQDWLLTSEQIAGRHALSQRGYRIGQAVYMGGTTPATITDATTDTANSNLLTVIVRVDGKLTRCRVGDFTTV